MFVGSWEKERHGGTGFFFALHFQFTTVFADDAADDEEPEAISGSFGSVEGFEDGSHDFGGHPSAVVADGKGDLVFV
mgnify:CR=1 FL=1